VALPFFAYFLAFTYTFHKTGHLPTPFLKLGRWMPPRLDAGAVAPPRTSLCTPLTIDEKQALSILHTFITLLTKYHSHFPANKFHTTFRFHFSHNNSCMWLVRPTYKKQRITSRQTTCSLISLTVAIHCWICHCWQKLS